MDHKDILPDLTKTAQKYREKVQLDVSPASQIVGEKTTIDEIMDSVNCQDQYRDLIPNFLSCPNFF